MRKLFLALLIASATTLTIEANESIEETTSASITQKEVPSSLYKIISMEDWQDSQKKAFVKLGQIDSDFIHLATEEQLDKVIQKYWNDVSEFVVLKVETNKLPGELAYESNPEGTKKYYHLYNGNIPLDAVADSKVVRR